MGGSGQDRTGRRTALTAATAPSQRVQDVTRTGHDAKQFILVIIEQADPGI